MEVVEEKKEQEIVSTKITKWHVLAYLIIYSFLGFCVETLYGILTKGVLESRQSFLYGPFCGIYDVGAAIMIVALQPLKKNNYTLFFGGYVLGTIIEFILSVIGEVFFHVKWWDYSSEPFNIQGRVCAFYSLFWGALAIYLINGINPVIDRFINFLSAKMPKRLLPILYNLIIVFLLFDFIVSCIAMDAFVSRLVYNHQLNIPEAETYIKKYEKICESPKWKEFTEKVFSDKKMVKTYPNLKLNDNNGNIIFVKDILSDIKPYYFKFYTPKNSIKLVHTEKVTYEEPET